MTYQTLTPVEQSIADRLVDDGWNDGAARMIARRLSPLVAEAERHGAIKALRMFAEALTEDDAVPWDTYAHEQADAIENGAEL